jgi:GGDEF domain-containing protein
MPYVSQPSIIARKLPSPIGIGVVSLYPTPDDASQTLMKRANECLYAAKTGGRKPDGGRCAGMNKRAGVA